MNERLNEVEEIDAVRWNCTVALYCLFEYEVVLSYLTALAPSMKFFR